MKILTIDIGTGTQDVLLFDSRLNIENGYKLILPSPTMQVWKNINDAACEKRDIALSGVLSGGGPSCWAVQQHLQNGLKVFATSEAAKTLDDDLEAVQKMGVILVSEEEMTALPDSVQRIVMGDFDFRRIHQVFESFGVTLSDLALTAISVFDHGNAPAGISDRKYRFEYLDRRLRQFNRLSALAYHAEDIPADLTRMLAVKQSADALPCPLMVMDSAPAAVLGAMLDARASEHKHNMVVNIGNGHTLACRLGPGGIEGFFEHHTGCLSAESLNQYLLDFAAGRLTNESVFSSQGHGALCYTQEQLPMDHDDFNFLVTGPRRNMVRQSALKPHFSAPFGDMMLAGCYGMLVAAADHYTNLAEAIRASFAEDGSQARAPWDLPD